MLVLCYLNTIVSAIQRVQVIIKTIIPTLSRLIAVISTVTGTIVVVLFVDVRQPFAGPSSYNFDHLLSEPHPFVIQPTISSVLSPPKNKSKMLEQVEVDSRHEYILPEANDPFESINRKTFAFNELVRQYLLDPLILSYNSVLPQFVRGVISNAFKNTNAPVVLANDLFQGEFERGFVTAGRLVINSTVGVAGLFDVAKKLGLEEHQEDFGQTLATWGMGDGFYLVLPLLGPSNPRDVVGQIFVDPFFDPLGYYFDNQDLNEVGYGLTALKGVVSYADVKDHMNRIRDTSVDFYGTIRSLHLQKRQLEILNQDRSN